MDFCFENQQNCNRSKVLEQFSFWVTKLSDGFFYIITNKVFCFYFFKTIKIFYRFFTAIKIFCFGFWQLQKFFVSFFWQLHIVYNACIQRSVLTDPGLVEGAAGADPLWCGCLLLLATTEPTDDVMIRHVVQLLLSQTLLHFVHAFQAWNCFT